MTLKTQEEIWQISNQLITNDNGASSHVETWGTNIPCPEKMLLAEIWACGAPCKINKYNEDGELTHYRMMNAIALRDHLRNYHAEIGHTLFMPWVETFFRVVKAFEDGRNQHRKAKEEKEANDLEKIKKEFGFVS